MAAIGSMKSTQPVATALSGMPVCSAPSCANVMPPSALIAWTPRDPSPPVPERTTPMARAPPILGERIEEGVDRQVRGRAFRPWREVEDAVSDQHLGAGRDHIDVIDLDRGTFVHRLHRHRRDLREKLDEIARIGRVEVLDEHHREAGLLAEMAEQLADRPEAAGRSAERDDGKRGDEILRVGGRLGGFSCHAGSHRNRT